MIANERGLFSAHIERLLAEYAKALEVSGFDGVVLASGAAEAKSPFDDQSWPLRVTPHFQHWLPLAQAGWLLFVEPGRRPTLFRPEPAGYWEGDPPIEGDHFWAEFDVRPMGEWRLPGRAAWIGRAVGATPPANATNPKTLIGRLDALRSVKTDYERACIAEANRRAWQGHGALRDLFDSGGHTELDLHLAYLRSTSQDDSETPYKNIVAFGEHAAVLHHVHYGRTASRAVDSLLVDAGATCFGYHSDITRTWVKGNGPSADAFRALVTEIDLLQQEACNLIRIGDEYEALHNRAHELLAAAMRKMKLSKASADELVASGATRKFLPHGLGHSLGLQTHDVGCRPREPEARNPYLRNTSIIAAGQVFTIEPGFYFIDTLLDELRAMPIAKMINWKLVDALKPFGGVRIEDNIGVLDKGIANFTRSAG